MDRRQALLSLMALGLAGCRTSTEERNLRLWSMWGGDENIVFDKVIADYNARHLSPPLENLGSVRDDKTIRALVAGAPPDLFTIRDPSMLGALAANNALRPLDDLFAAEGWKQEDFTPGALSQCRYNGKLYAIPYLLDCIVLMYNKDVFRAAGLDPERPPTTMEELEETCRKLTKRGPDGRLNRIGLRPPEALHLMGACGAVFVDKRTGKITADHPNNIAAAATFKRLMDVQGGNEEVTAFAQGFAEDMGPNNPFFRGLAAMQFSGQWNSNWVWRYTPGVQVGIAPLPFPAAKPELRGTVWLGGNPFSIALGAKRANDVWPFLRWSQSVEGQLTFAKAIHGVPNQRAVLSEPSLRTGTPWRPLFGQFLDLANHPNATHFPPLPVAAYYQSEINAAVDAVRYGRLEPEAALRAVQERIQREMDKYPPVRPS